MDQENLSRQIIVDHHKNPHNKIDKIPNGYTKVVGVNPSCGDQLELYYKIEDNKVIDIKWNGEGCSICCSSTSVMTNEIIDNDINYVMEKINIFQKMLLGEEVDVEIFEDAIAFSNLFKFPARYKCANLSWNTLKEELEKEKNE